MPKPNKLQERRDAQNEVIKPHKKSSYYSNKKSLLLTSIEKDVKHSDELSIEAEAEKDFSILHMSNSL